MKQINNILHELQLVPTCYEKNGKTTIIKLDDDVKIVAKKHKNNMYQYLNNRSFNYYPELIYQGDYDISLYEEEIPIPDEQKILDLIDLISLLHSKTTYYESINIDHYQSLYEDIDGNIKYLKLYYDDIMLQVENTIYMSPSQYYLARNISVIYSSLDLCHDRLEKWYRKAKELTKHRVVVLHNNLSLKHLINNKLISWDKSKIGIPIFDLYKLYKTYYDKFEWDEIINRYTRKYPLKNEELELFILLISIPNKIELTNNEFNSVKNISTELNYISHTKHFTQELKKDDDTN